MKKKEKEDNEILYKETHNIFKNSVSKKEKIIDTDVKEEQNKNLKTKTRSF